MTLGSDETIKQAVAAGLGLAVLSRHVLTLDPAEGPCASSTSRAFRFPANGTSSTCGRSGSRRWRGRFWRS